MPVRISNVKTFWLCGIHEMDGCGPAVAFDATNVSDSPINHTDFNATFFNVETKTIYGRGENYDSGVFPSRYSRHVEIWSDKGTGILYSGPRPSIRVQVTGEFDFGGGISMGEHPIGVETVWYRNGLNDDQIP